VPSAKRQLVGLLVHEHHLSVVHACQVAREPWVCKQATMPTANSRSPVSVRIAPVRVRAATRAISTIRAEPLRDREDDLPVRHGREERGVQPLGPDREAFRVAAGAEVPAFAGEGEQVLVGTVVTPDAREAVLEDAAGEELVRDLRDHGAPRAVLVREALVVHRLQPLHVIRHQPKQRRRLRTPGLVDAEGRGRRRLVSHARSQTVKRRA
jgi:hypothetical protein